MSAEGRNEGFLVLDDFVCEAIHVPSIPLASPLLHSLGENRVTYQELRAAVQATPFRPFTLRMADGRSFDRPPRPHGFRVRPVGS